jgi:Eco57I restriction endonuclease.
MQLNIVDNARKVVSKNTAKEHKSEFGQYLTPASVARFMASLFVVNDSDVFLLDPGAGLGALACAFIDRFGNANLDVTAYELDSVLIPELHKHLTSYTHITSHVLEADFITYVSKHIDSAQNQYTHAILNPPYKKISSISEHRKSLRSVGIETVNMYSAFVALTIAQMKQFGQVVAIIPRSFCNGPYYKPFREFILSRSAITHIHLFDSRDKAFRDDDVLQENIIIKFEVGKQQSNVIISTSLDDSFEDFSANEFISNHIIDPNDPDKFIHIPVDKEQEQPLPSILRYSLNDINISVSTGPVVDFRLKDHLKIEIDDLSVPLLYPGHFNNGGLCWPNSANKPSAILYNSDTSKWLYPNNGFYCVVKRFTSKEERRRIVANVVDTSMLPTSFIGFENHLNVFHFKKNGIHRHLAYGIAAYLNTSLIDNHFRRFSGHTQVNVTDLKKMPYPDHDFLIKFGIWFEKCAEKTQEQIDKKLEELLNEQ